MADSILPQLQSAAKGLLYPSEQDHPIKAFLWPKAAVGGGALDAAAVKKQAKSSSDAPVAMQPVDDFFAPITTPQSWHSDTEKQSVQQAQQLAAAVKQLSDVHVYRIGDTKKQVVVAGKTPQGDFAGVMTQVVET